MAGGALAAELAGVPPASLYRHVARLADLWLTDAELHEMGTEISDVVLPRLANRPGPGRSRRVLRTFLLPDSEPNGTPPASEE
jgi:hypothetical protein